MMMMRHLLVALATITLPLCSSFQPITPHPLSVSVRKANPIPQSPLKVPPRAGGAPMMVTVNGDKKATFSVDGPLAKTSAVAAGTFFTYALHTQLTNMGPVQASGIVAIASTLLLPPQLALGALCGSFAGMAKTAVIPTLFSAGLLGILCSALLTLFDKKAWLIGVGGRLGFISQCACTLQFLILKYGQKVWQASEKMQSMLGSTAPAAVIADFSLYEQMTLTQIKAQVPPLVVFTVGGALFMRLFMHLGKQFELPNKVSNSVAAVGTTGLLGGMYLSPSIAGPAFCGSFVSMASPAVLPNLITLILASVLAGISQLGLTGLLLGGWGGKLGTSAFLGVFGYRILTKATNSIATTFGKAEIIRAAQKP
jgi:hypothetical protein